VIGIIITLSAIAVSLLISGIRYTNDDWAKTAAENSAASA
jgi:type II secretory pathway pseudopilin PulG